MKVIASYRKNYLSALLLLAIYVLHLGVFDLLMDAPSQVRSGDVRFSSYHHSQTNDSSPSLAAYYQSVLKHEDASKHDQVYKAFTGFALPCDLWAPVMAVPAEDYVSYHSPLSLRLSDDAFERYRLLNVFLI